MENIKAEEELYLLITERIFALTILLNTRKDLDAKTKEAVNEEIKALYDLLGEVFKNMVLTDFLRRLEEV